MASSRRQHLGILAALRHAERRMVSAVRSWTPWPAERLAASVLGSAACGGCQWRWSFIGVVVSGRQRAELGSRLQARGGIGSTMEATSSSAASRAPPALTPWAMPPGPLSAGAGTKVIYVLVRSASSFVVWSMASVSVTAAHSLDGVRCCRCPRLRHHHRSYSQAAPMVPDLMFLVILFYVYEFFYGSVNGKCMEVL